MAYWRQWNVAELMSMHGIEPDDERDVPYLYDPEPEATEVCECANCDTCIGISWKDFI